MTSSEATVRKWRSRSSTEDHSHTPPQVAIAIYLHKQLLLPLVDDLLAVGSSAPRHHALP